MQHFRKRELEPSKASLEKGTLGWAFGNLLSTPYKELVSFSFVFIFLRFTYLICEVMERAEIQGRFIPQMTAMARAIPDTKQELRASLGLPHGQQGSEDLSCTLAGTLLWLLVSNGAEPRASALERCQCCR